MSKITLGSILGEKDIEDFNEFDLTEVQKVLSNLANENAIDLAHSEWLQQRALYGAELLLDMNAKMIKTVGFLEAKLNTLKNRCALEYKSEDGGKITMEMRRFASEANKDVEELNILLTKAKGGKLLIEKKYDLMIKAHYHFKEISQKQKQNIINGASKYIEPDNKVGW